MEDTGSIVEEITLFEVPLKREDLVEILMVVGPGGRIEDDVDQWEAAKFIAEIDEFNCVFIVLCMDVNRVCFHSAEVVIQDCLRIGLILNVAQLDWHVVVFF